MAFIESGNTVISYAEAQDVRDRDQRLFEANEIDFTSMPDSPSTLDEYVEDLATRSTQRINHKIRSSTAWREYLGYTGTNYGAQDIPEFDPGLIRNRQLDFTDMCVYYTLKEFLLPKVADWGNPESPEVQKIEYYSQKFSDLFQELLSMMDWYDIDQSGSVEPDEQRYRFTRTRRTRGRRSIVRTR